VLRRRDEGKIRMSQTLCERPAATEVNGVRIVDSNDQPELTILSESSSDPLDRRE
jgi:hypothetical protein